MGLPLLSLLVLLLLQSSSLSLPIDDLSSESYDLFGPEDDSDLETYLGRQARAGDKFLRFGKAMWDYDTGNDAPYDEREVPKPTHTGSLTGNPQQRSPRDKSSFLRFGRSINEENSKKKRDKRDAVSTSEALKRHENYLRFGRSNSNFMRFGRIPQDEQTTTFNLRNKQHVLNYLKNLLRQSEDRRNMKKLII